MALIKCPECGGAVSSKAKACVHCGCPLDAPGWEEARDDGLCRVVIEEAGSMPLFLLIHSFDEKCSSSFGPIGASGGAGAMALTHRRMRDLPFTAYEALKREEAERVEERLKEIDAGVVVTIEPTGLEHSEERCPRCGSTETMGPWTVLFEGAGLRITAGDQKLCMQGRCALRTRLVPERPLNRASPQGRPDRPSLERRFGGNRPRPGPPAINLITGPLSQVRPVPTSLRGPLRRMRRGFHDS